MDGVVGHLGLIREFKGGAMAPGPLIIPIWTAMQWTKILSNRVSIQDFVFAREVR